MYFNKIHNPQNFSFSNNINSDLKQFSAGLLQCEYKIDDLGADVYRFSISSERWTHQYSQAPLTDRFEKPSNAHFSIDNDNGIRLLDSSGKQLLKSAPGRIFGVSGKAWLLSFSSLPQTQFYGMGEKNVSFERSGLDTKFWNTDVWADFNPSQIESQPTDPMYVSVPYLIVKNGNDYTGILVNNPFAVFMSTPPEQPRGSRAKQQTRSDFYIGAPEGLPELYFIAGPTLAQLTSKLQKIVGVTPLPPLWALGHHQCRWQYAGPDDLNYLDRSFKKNHIPNDGLWLDIDYMDGYRVFSFSPNHWKNPQKEIEEITKSGQKVVPILDPGVKVDPGYEPYNELIEKGAYCTGPEGTPFQGYVWPGLTVFPDFSTEAGRSWWASRVEKMAKTGIDGAWLDMNDPAVGRAELDPMRFGKSGENPHETFHSQYALGMAMASREGFLKASPNTRPFLLSRSGFIGTSRYSAVWTGDNMSNEWYLKQSLPMTLNLALSGIPFNGADVCGFVGDTTPALAIAWYKAAFLMPFFRNHCNKGERDQEPWRFGSETMHIIRRYIRLRYKLLPYLYNLFIDQEESGAAIVRPLFYDFDDTKALPLGKIDDQYMLGPSIMHAPVLDSHSESRNIVLPKGNWFDALKGKWISGPQKLEKIGVDRDETPIYIRDGSIIPMLCGEPTDNDSDLSSIECHLFISASHTGAAHYAYRFDDGETFDYKNGKRTAVTIQAEAKDKRFKIDLKNIQTGYKALNMRFVVYGEFSEINLTVGERETTLAIRKKAWKFAGKNLTPKISEPIEIG